MTGKAEDEIASRWTDVKERVLRYAATDGRNSLKALISAFNTNEGNSGLNCTVICVSKDHLFIKVKPHTIHCIFCIMLLL